MCVALSLSQERHHFSSLTGIPSTSPNSMISSCIISSSQPHLGHSMPE